MLAFIDHVIPDQRFALVGKSWGGILSRAVLAKRFDQVDGLCLIVTPIIIQVLPHPFPGPTLIFMGRQDTVVRHTDAWPIVENFPRATVALLDRASHLAMVHQRTLFNALVNEWLDRLEEYIGR